MTDQLLTITSGLPFAKEFNITLPIGRTWWLELTDFEVLMQIREEKKRDSTLVMDLAQYLTVVKVDTDIFKVNLEMTGSDTRNLLRGGYYDVVMSDMGITDERAFVLLKGPIKRQTIISAEAPGAP